MNPTDNLTLDERDKRSLIHCAILERCNEGWENAPEQRIGHGLQKAVKSRLSVAASMNGRTLWRGGPWPQPMDSRLV